MSEAYTLMHVPVRLVETIQGIASGEMVAVPRETGMDFGASPSRTIAVRMVWKDGLLQQTEIPMEEFLAAAKDVRHD